jgi:hypothetical protein
MKKTAFFIALTLGSTAVFAQDLTSKKGEPILPETGDWAISFDASSMLRYAGNLFSGSTSQNAPPTADWTNPSYMLITGKMFKDEKTAYRASVRLGFTSNKRVGMIADASQTTAPVYPALPNMKEDDVKNLAHNVGIGIGLEKRRGKTRLQGYYGADAWIWTSGQSLKYDYGNTLNPGGSGVNPVPANTSTTTDFGTNSVLTTVTGNTSNVTGVKDTYGNAGRITSVKAGQTFGLGLRAFIGAEYFIFPKISIGAEYGFGFGFSTTSNSSYTVESIGGSPAKAGSQQVNVARKNNFGLDNDINGGGSNTGSGAIKLTLHF